jgi:hypothetical protein
VRVSAAGGPDSADAGRMLDVELSCTGVDVVPVASPRSCLSEAASKSCVAGVTDILSCRSHASFAWRRELGRTYVGAAGDRDSSAGVTGSSTSFASRLFPYSSRARFRPCGTPIPPTRVTCDALCCSAWSRITSAECATANQLYTGPGGIHSRVCAYIISVRPCGFKE